MNLVMLIVITLNIFMRSVVAPFMEVKLADVLCTKPGVDVKKLFTDVIYEYY